MPSSWRQKSIPLHFPTVSVGKVLALALQPSLCLCPSVAVCDWQEMEQPSAALHQHWAVQWLHWEALAQLKPQYHPAAQPSLVCGLQISQIHELLLRHQ